MPSQTQTIQPREPRQQAHGFTVYGDQPIQEQVSSNQVQPRRQHIRRPLRDITNLQL